MMLEYNRRSRNAINFNWLVFESLNLFYSNFNENFCFCFANKKQSDGLQYLFKNLKRISSEKYRPSNQDLLHTRVPTRTVEEYSVDYKGISFRFIDVGGQRKQRKKWLQCFDSMLTSILFVVSTIEYDQFLVEDCTVNRLEETLTVFDLIINSEFFRETSIILFLNKTDLLAEKLKQLKRKNFRPPAMYYLKDDDDDDDDLFEYDLDYDDKGDDRIRYGCGTKMLDYYFPEFDGNPTSLKQIQRFLQNLFLCRCHNRQIYSHFTTAVDTENIKKVFNNVRETILRVNIKSIINLE